MLTYINTFSSFSVNDVEAAKDFYQSILGVGVEETKMGLQLQVKGGAPIFIYQKDDHVPATFTVLNFTVEDIDKAVDELTGAGVSFEHYDGAMQTDEKGILRGINAGMGPDIAWFKDPSGNFLSVLEE